MRINLNYQAKHNNSTDVPGLYQNKQIEVLLGTAISPARAVLRRFLLVVLDHEILYFHESIEPRKHRGQQQHIKTSSSNTSTLMIVY